MAHPAAQTGKQKASGRGGAEPAVMGATPEAEWLTLLVIASTG